MNIIARKFKKIIIIPNNKLFKMWDNLTIYFFIAFYLIEQI